MKEKLKKFNIASIITILKASLIGVIASILMVLLFAFVLKFVDLGSGAISIIDQIIKIISIVIAVIVLNNVVKERVLFKSFLAGALYSIITFIVFSILDGGISFGVGIVSDIIFSALVAGATSIVISIMSKK